MIRPEAAISRLDPLSYESLRQQILGETAGGNYYLSEATRALRWQALSNLFLPPHHWHGRHDLKFGVDFDRLVYDAQFARQPISYWPVATTSGPCPTNSNGVPTLPSPCSCYSTFSGGSPSSTYNFESSAYAEDRWLITDRLLVGTRRPLRLGRNHPHPSRLTAPRGNLRPRQLGQYQVFRGNWLDLRSHASVSHRPSLRRSTH